MNEYYAIYSENDYRLYHFGILGQKWGVKNGPPYPLDTSKMSYSERKERNREDASEKESKGFELTDQQKKILIAGAVATAGALAVYGTYKLNESRLDTPHVLNISVGKMVDLSKVSTERMTIPKSQKLQRISSKKIEDYVEDGKRIYASFERGDNHLYKRQMPKFINDWYDSGIVDSPDAYVHKISLKKNLNVASEMDVMKAYMHSNKVTEVDEGHFTMFIRNLVDNDSDVAKDFYKELRESGLDAMIDYNDAQNWSKSPLIIFNPNDVVDKSESHKLGKLEKVINVLTY